MSTRIWILQTSFVGDCVLTLPLVARSFENVPDAEVHLLTTRGGAALFEVAKARGLRAFADRLVIHVYDKKNAHRGWRAGIRFVRDLSARHGRPDVVLCAQRSFRSGMLAVLSGAPVRVGFSSGAASYMYTHAVQRDWDSGRSEIEKNLDLLRTWRATESIEAWDPVAAPSLLARALGARPVKDPPVLVALGSPWHTKRWPVENAIELVQPLTTRGQRVILIGEADAAPLAQAVREAVPSLLLEDRCGRTSIEEWVDQVAEARVLVSGDSAAVHVASDLKVPVLALFGPTAPEFGFAPWRKGSLALGVKDLPCRPCHIHGPRVCPLGHHKCMKDLKAERVLRFLERYLDREPEPENP